MLFVKSRYCLKMPRVMGLVKDHSPSAGDPQHSAAPARRSEGPCPGRARYPDGWSVTAPSSARVWPHTGRVTRAPSPQVTLTGR